VRARVCPQTFRGREKDRARARARARRKRRAAGYVAALNEAFEPEEARRLSKKFEIHDTPKHGSWLNIAEIQLSVLARQALDQRDRFDGRPPEQRSMLGHAQRAPSPVRWRFTTTKARIKLRRLYPDTE
jgi:hypothetical protein